MRKVLTVIAAALALTASLQAQELTNFNFGGRLP